MADELDLVVHAFEGAVADPASRPGQNAGLVGADHASKVLEGLEPRVAIW